MSLHVAHLLLVACWAGVLGAEFVLELLPLSRPDLRPATVAFHYWIDVVLELPLIAGIVLTGALLLAGRPIDARLGVKLAGAAIALGANLACALAVVARHRGPPEKVGSRTRFVYATAAVGVPGGLVALYLGLGG